MDRYKLFNSLTGWFVFTVAAVLYLTTMEPTTSFWDCGEFIGAAYKLQVGHPPGAPFFLLLGRLFSLFAGDPSRVAMMINALSALASALTILFLFWTITHLMKKILLTNTRITTGRMIAVLGSGLIGSLAYSFSDTFWFSAVEGEVYALSSLFTAVVFWAILKWEERADEPSSSRWLLLIAYLMGLSIGVHLLNLLAIPAITMVYYFRKHKPTRNGVVIALLVSMIILGFMIYFLIPGFVKVASWFELLFVNGLSLPYHSGVIFYLILVIFLIAAGLYYTQVKGKVAANTVLLAFTVVLIGYSSYAMIIIRSSANPPMDQNNPQNVFSLLKYLNREQYQASPLLKGPYYNAPVIDVKEGKPTYVQEDGRYVIAARDPEYVYDPRFVTVFPRMWSRNEEQHIQDYKDWGKVKGERITVQGYSEGNNVLVKPTFGENLRFFFRYQLGHMYFRYFMWNFSGRQNDIQGHGNVLDGNWISGIPFIDNPRLGPQEDLPETYKNNPARNRYYMLPLLLGILGMVFLYRKNVKDFWVIMLLFLMTGVAIVIYLNQWPHQPRERDYAYAGSFYAFSIWIGMGAGYLYMFGSKFLKEIPAAVMALILPLPVPLLMLTENYDDHNRAKRYSARDFAANYLNSCDQNAILFTNGDNDTFPLWYVQDVEGIRTDVRVVNLSYLGADWYITQMKARAYDSPPVPFSLEEKQYRKGTRDIVLIQESERLQGFQDINQVFDFVASDDPRTQTTSPFMRGERLHFSPTAKLRIPVDTVKVLQNGTVSANARDEVLPYLDWEINRNMLYKNDLMILDLMASNRWERPVYFAVTVPRSSYLGLEPFFQLDGLAYRVVPILTETGVAEIGRIETSVMYENIMEKFRWGGVTDPDVYLDENNLRMLSNFRYHFNRLAEELIKEEKLDSARRVMDRALELFPNERIPYNYFSLKTVENLYKLNEMERADAMLGEMVQMFEEEVRYILRLDRDKQNSVLDILQLDMHILQQLASIVTQYGDEQLRAEILDRFQHLINLYNISP